jgi:CRP/FNR family cyclic AMP-dependent transcriptional regulator
MTPADTKWPLLSGLGEADRDELLSNARPQQFSRGEFVVREGEYGESLHLIRRGRLSARVSTSKGQSLTLSVLSPGDAFGELAVTGQVHRRSTSVVALEPSETLRVSGQAFHALCQRNPTLERVVICLLAERVEKLSDRLLEVSYLSVDRRVYRRLLELMEIYRDGTEMGSIPLTQDDIAGLASTTRPSVNNVLQCLQRQGVIDLGRARITILDRTELARRARP